MGTGAYTETWSLFLSWAESGLSHGPSWTQFPAHISTAQAWRAMTRMCQIKPRSTPGKKESEDLHAHVPDLFHFRTWISLTVLSHTKLLKVFHSWPAGEMQHSPSTCCVSDLALSTYPRWTCNVSWTQGTIALFLSHFSRLMTSFSQLICSEFMQAAIRSLF